MVEPRRRVTTMRVLAGASGVLAGVGGAVHGVGEVLQRGEPSPGIFLESWTSGPIAENLGGEPALSLVPDVFLSGLLTLASAAAVIWWSATSTDQRYGGRVLVALSLLMLLVGGGVGPPTMGLLAALVAGTANRARVRTDHRTRGRSGELLAAAWPTSFWLALGDNAFLVIGSLVAGVLLDVDISSVFVYGLLLSLILMPFAALAGTAHAAMHPLTAVLPDTPTSSAHESRSR